MMTNTASKSRAAFFMAAWLAAFALPLCVFGYFVYQKHHWAQDRLEELNPRYARLLGLEARRDQLDEAERRAAAALGRFAYPASLEVSQAGNDAQQRVRSLFAQARLEVVSSQVLPVKVEQHFDRIPMTFRVEGDLTGLQSAWLVLSGQSPTILVDSFSVQPFGTVTGDAPQRLVSQLGLSVLRARP